MMLTACLPLAGACQKLDPHLSDGLSTTNVTTDGTGGNGRTVGGTGGSNANTGTGGQSTTSATGGSTSAGAPDGGHVSCDTLRSQARAVLENNCAYCHQSPGSLSSPYGQGSFDFILELDKLTSMISPNSPMGAPLKYVVMGDPGKSYVFQRISNSSMPPVAISRRPNDADKRIVSDWIATCVDGSSAGWLPPNKDLPTPDAGTPIAEGCGGPGQACCAANVCNSGGCCVFGQCRANGVTCAGTPATDTMPAIPGLAGSCKMGSCLTATGMSCGKVAEPCCDLMTCTDSQSSCLAGMTTCAACGGTDQPCCKPNNCLDGRVCTGGGVGRIGTCVMCGDLGQACCGAGVAAQQTCHGTLACVSVTGMGNICSAGAGAGTGGSGGTNPGTGGQGGRAGTGGQSAPAGSGGQGGGGGRGGRGG